MNTNFNLRYKTTEEKIEEALLSLLHIRKYNDISIKELCYEAGINRSSFYAHYQDINSLMMDTEKKLSQEIAKIFEPTKKFTNETFVELFRFLLKYKDFYKSYLMTNEQAFMEKNDFVKFGPQMKKNGQCNNYSDREFWFHMAFFGGGLKAISKMWLSEDCKETPEQMAKILLDEYKNNSKYFN